MHRGNGNISVSQVHDYFPSSNFRIIIVSGSLSSVSFIISLICIRAARLNRNETPDEDAFVSLETLAQVPEPVMKEIISIKISIPASAAGMMIGNGGEFVRSVCSQSGASIVISDTVVMNERLMHIDGPTAACIVGINMILEQLISDPRYSRYDNYVASYTRLNNFNSYGNHSIINNYQNYGQSSYPPAALPYHSVPHYPPGNPAAHMGYDGSSYNPYKRPVASNANMNYYQPQQAMPDYRQPASVPIARPMFSTPPQNPYRGGSGDAMSGLRAYSTSAPAPMHNQAAYSASASSLAAAPVGSAPGVEILSSQTTVTLLCDGRYVSMFTIDFTGEPESGGAEDSERKGSLSGDIAPPNRTLLHDIMVESNVSIAYSPEPNESGAHVFTITGATKAVDRAVQLIQDKCHEINRVQE